MAGPTPRPPDPDQVAARGSAQYNDAVHVLHQWVAHNLARGVPMDQLVDHYDDQGNIHHDWKEWNDWGGGFQRPAEWGDEQWNQGNFQKQIKNFDQTEWPPGSGIYFNDPGNDSNKRQWLDQYGDPTGQPSGASGMPEIDYNAVASGYGGNIGKYLADEMAHRKNSAKSPGYVLPTGAPIPAGQPQSNTSNAVAPVGNVGNVPAPASTAGPTTHGAWGVSSMGNVAAQPSGNNMYQRPLRQMGPGRGAMQGSMAINPFQRAGQPGGSFSQPQGYTPWRR